MWITDRIFSIVWDVSTWFRIAWYDVRDWYWPFNTLADPLYFVSDLFWQMLTPIAHLGDWISDVTSKVDNVLTSWDIMSLLDEWITYAENAWAWVSNSWWNVWNIIESWWTSVRYEVRSWIDSARDAVELLISQAELSVVDLRSSWDDFWTISWPDMLADLGGLRAAWDSFIASTLPDLANWTGIGDLINSTILTWFPFYDELASLWGEIREFFANPLDWIAGQLETWFWEE